MVYDLTHLMALQRESTASHPDKHTANLKNQQHCERSGSSFEIVYIPVLDPRVVEPRRSSRFHQERWNRTKKHRDGLSQQRSGLREASLDGKVEMSQERAPTKRISSELRRKDLDAKIETDPYAHRGLAATVLAGGNTRALRVWCPRTRRQELP